MDTLQKLLIDFELHSPEGIKEAFNNGIDPNEMHNNKPLFYEFINFYPRGPKFKECVRAFVDSGLHFDDKILLSVLSDDAAELEKLLIQNPGLANGIYSFDCTFTPLYKASLLHICAEYNHVSCAKILVKFGADVNSKAGIDELGLGGQTPIFHTVNQNDNKCMDIMNYLLSINADLSITVRGLIWGKGYEWETFIPAVNPISYAMMGLLRQFQRTEIQIYEIVSKLLESSWGIK